MSNSLSLAVFSHENHSSAELADRIFDETEFYKTASSPALLLQTCNRIEILSRKSGDALSAFLESAGKDGRSEERRVGKECRSRWSPYH